MIPIPPSWIVAGSIAVAGLASFTVQEIQKSNLRADLAAVRLELAEQKTVAAELAANRDKLVADLEVQNAAIEKLKANAEKNAAEAAARLAEMLRGFETRRRDIAARPGTGPKEMNSWLKDYFRSP